MVFQQEMSIIKISIPGTVAHRPNFLGTYFPYIHHLDGKIQSPYIVIKNFLGR